MTTTRLSSKGQVVIPRATRTARRWSEGTELQVVDTPDGVLLRTVKPFPESRIADVFGMAKYRGPKRSIAEMDAAVRAEAARRK